jgi:hypothetical protein
MLKLFLIVASITLAALAMIWSPRTWANLFVKLFLTALTIMGLFLILQQFGFVVRAA